MLHDLANDVSFVALKWAAEDTEGWRLVKFFYHLIKL